MEGLFPLVPQLEANRMRFIFFFLSIFQTLLTNLDLSEQGESSVEKKSVIMLVQKTHFATHIMWLVT